LLNSGPPTKIKVQKRFTELPWPDGNPSIPAALNLAIRSSLGEYIVIMHDDVNITSNDWLEWLLGYAQDPTVGVVGGKILLTDNTVDEFGLILGENVILSSIFKGFDSEYLGEFNRARLIQNTSAVSSTLMMFQRSKFDQLNGFDGSFIEHNFDIDFCIRMKALGLFNVIIPYCLAHHKKSKSRIDSSTQESDNILFSERHSDLLKATDSYLCEYAPAISYAEAVAKEYAHLDSAVSKNDSVVESTQDEVPHKTEKKQEGRCSNTEPPECVFNKPIAGMVTYIVPWYQQIPVAITSLIAQTYKDIEIIVVHDGVPPKNVTDYVKTVNDPRVKLINTNTVSGDWGHTPRSHALNFISNRSDAVVFTGIDNYYLPSFTEELFTPFLKKKEVAATYCNFIHNKKNWNVIDSKLEYTRIDCGCFMVKSNIALRLRWGNRVSWEDWVFIEKVLRQYGESRIIKIPKMLYIHN
jgi:GT2 family glycosyltransferase